MTTTTNNHVAALAAIKATPIGESGQYLHTTFFRDGRRHITVIRDGQAQQFNNDHGAAELVHANLTGGSAPDAELLEAATATLQLWNKYGLGDNDAESEPVHQALANAVARANGRV